VTTAITRTPSPSTATCGVMADRKFIDRKAYLPGLSAQ
jgi:hypothetical protein